MLRGLFALNMFVCSVSEYTNNRLFNSPPDFMHIRYRLYSYDVGYNCEFTDGNTPYFLADYHFENADLVVVGSCYSKQGRPAFPTAPASRKVIGMIYC